MSKYEEMSDKQLCEAVLRIKRPEICNNDFVFHWNDPVLAVFHAGRSGGYAGHFSLDWACVGPLIVKANINLLSMENGVDHWDAVALEHIVSHKNPLRAAAIVYLMIKDSE